MSEEESRHDDDDDDWGSVGRVTLTSVHPFSPDAADSSSFDVQLGDIIVTATDGLFDNMPDHMILQELKNLKVGGAAVLRVQQLSGAA